ncbi:MAG: energy transducer TonB [Ignavibacteriae bacterium]|nr:energy transducer TonB [Ignavibacteriota bacterium]
MASRIAIVMPAPSTYGAIELKEIIRKYTWKAFFVTVASIIILLLLYFASVKISEATANKFKMAPMVKIDITDLPPPPSETEDVPPPPAEQIINTGPASRAGTPVPVPETEITADLKEFASMEELGRASSIGGEGVDLGGFASNIDVDRKVNVDVRETEGDPWEFVAVEKEPYIDLAELQRKIVYPEMARRAGVEGKVTVRVYVNKDGRPSKTIIEASDNELLNDAARSAIMKSVFTPAIQNGSPVALWVSIPINFRLR